MAIVAFDTLAYSEHLQNVGIPRDQADAMARANAEALRNLAITERLSTKDDLLELRQDIQEESQAQSQKAEEEFKAVRREMQEEFKAVRREMAGFKQEMQEEFKSVRREMVEFKQEMQEKFQVQSQKIEEEFKVVRREMQEEFKAVRREMDEFKQDNKYGNKSLKQDILDLKYELGTVRNDLIKWTLSMMLGLSAVLITAFGVAIAFLK